MVQGRQRAEPVEAARSGEGCDGVQAGGSGSSEGCRETEDRGESKARRQIEACSEGKGEGESEAEGKANCQSEKACQIQERKGQEGNASREGTIESALETEAKTQA